MLRAPPGRGYECGGCAAPGGQWRSGLQGALRSGMRAVLRGLRSSAGGDGAVGCAQCPPGGAKLHSGPCDLSAVGALLEGGHYGSVQGFSEDVVGVLLRGGAGGGPQDDGARELFIQLMLEAFPWFDIRDPKRWRPPGTGGVPNGLLPHAVLPPSADHTYAQWRQDPPGPPPEVAVPQEEGGAAVDERQCALCLQCGDAPSQEAGRLLYIGQNEWTHVNCAVWSAEVFEESDGSLRNVHAAVARGRQMRCELCRRPGATVGCCLSACLANYHFMCARRRRAAFQRDKKVFCQRHTALLDGTLVQDGDFAVLRRVFVDFAGISFKRKFLGGLEPGSVHMMIGSIRIDSLGALTELSECDGRLYPVGYQCRRLYWSTRDARRRCWYRCRILEHRPPPGPGGGTAPGDPHEENRTIAHGPQGGSSGVPPSPPRTPPPPPEAPRGPPGGRPPPPLPADPRILPHPTAAPGQLLAAAAIAWPYPRSSSPYPHCG